MNILDKIVGHKRKEVEERKVQRSVAELEKTPLFAKRPFSLKRFLLDEARTGIVAEYKRRSPSKGVINDKVSVEEVTKAYTRHGASGISVLTDEKFFGGSLDDLLTATANEVPLLRKDFTIDEYQLYEAKAYGADVVLLIAACLSPDEVKRLSRTAKRLGLEVLLELHDESELNHIGGDIDLVGINNRNLKTFTVDLERSVRLSEKIGNDFIKIAESGIQDAETVVFLKKAGFRGFLIGEYFMKQPDPMIAFADFVNQLKAKECV